MKKIAVDCLSDASNYSVIRSPGRRFPAILVQGDSLRTMADLAGEIQEMVKRSSNDELRATVDELVEQLQSRVKHYEQVMADEHLPLPYGTFKQAV